MAWQISVCPCLVLSELNYYVIRNKIQTAMINIAIKSMLENNVHLLDVSYVSTISSEVTVRNRTNNLI